MTAAPERETPFFGCKDHEQRKIIYTLTDEAPALATYSLLPIVQAFTKAAAAPSRRAISRSPDGSWRSSPSGSGQSKPSATISRSSARSRRRPRRTSSSCRTSALRCRSCMAAIQGAEAAGLRRSRLSGGAAHRGRERRSRRKYAKVLGSAVNPVLREGNSDRRVAASVKQYAKKHPHSMGRWSKDSRTHVASMGGGDFYSSEQSAVVQKAGKLNIELTSNRGEKTVLKEGVERQGRRRDRARRR